MGIYKRDKKSPYWWADVSVPGHPRIRRSTETTDRIEAQKIHDQWRAELWHKPTQADRRTLLSTLALQWCAVDGRSESDILSVNKFMQHYGDRCVTAVAQDRDGIDRAMRAFIKTPGTYTRYRAIINAILKRAHADGLIPDMPTLHKWPVGKRKKAPRFIEDKNKLDELVNALPAHQQGMVLFSVATGLRQSNVLNLKWSNVDMTNKTVWISAEETKAGKILSIPLNAAAIKVLERQMEQAHPTYVFTYRGHPIKEIKKAFIKACVAVGLGTLTEVPNPDNKSGVSQHYEGLRWHDLRHTFASWHAMKGTPPQVIQVLGGWASMRMVENYTHLAPSFVATYAENIT